MGIVQSRRPVARAVSRVVYTLMVCAALACGVLIVGCDRSQDDKTSLSLKPKKSSPVLTPQYKKAASWLEAGRTQPAIDLCLLHVEKEPDCHRVLGVGYRLLKNKDKACIHLQTYLKRDDVRDADEIKRMIRALACVS